MALDIRTFGDPVLKSRAAPVDKFDDALEHLVVEMLDTMHEQEGVGLAANQVGRLKRVLVAGFEDEEHVLVNPVIEERSDVVETDTEGCLSIPGITVDIERSAEVRVSGQDVAGAPVQLTAVGLLARILQHEIDHLNGILILDRTDRESRKAAMREMRERLMAQQ